ncbi:flavin-containing monooxygenase [Salimicrobium halophilum]|uniref:Predicted flavoprotein CzcO associated with the cation diffusion facilitator CzcD n=1 Tax=Salimicrobium halophilum TaxID=86666 RepID=A0A1G8RJ24_9BACI|nr:NAD(P)/FAD-dependent oxidoreductase [Salimicrobium halophilum]SDJ16873.1 Predicted flavoprotein CzcO associated with the cation diffusion facilitator CzcD [Salimicrobium halophilum]
MNRQDVDAVVVGAGFSGLYMLYRLREAGMTTRAFEAADGVGGVWYWNRYPGARCDSESIYYNYTFSKELFEEWSWSSRYPEQPEILDYLNHMADKFELKPHITFNTKVMKASFHEDEDRWYVDTESGEQVRCKYFITGVGCISAANVPDIPGLDRFEGEWYHTGHWPHEKVDFTGERVGVVGTGSSGIQSIPVIAEEAEHLSVFQRTPQYSIPANNYPYSEEFKKQVKNDYDTIRRQMRESVAGLKFEYGDRCVLDDSPEKRYERLQDGWDKGGWHILFTYNDLLTNEEGNEKVASFVQDKIKEIVDDPDTAEKLTPDHYYGTKRAIVDTNYFETYNLPHVTLVDVKESPIQEITETGVKTSEGEYPLDALVFATGFDGMTGSLFKMDIRGRRDLSLKDKWKDGEAVRTYLGLATAEFPNMFMLTGPESPSVLGNMPAAIEQHVEWVMDCIEDSEEEGVSVIEAEEEAEVEWSAHCREMAESTLYIKTDSWYTGANIEGKAKGFPIYVGGYGPYRTICDEVREKNYEGFHRYQREEL